MKLFCIKNHQLKLEYASTIFIYNCVDKECWIEETKERHPKKYSAPAQIMKVSRYQLVLGESNMLWEYHLDYPEFGIELSNQNMGNGKCACSYSLGSRYEYHDFKYVETLYGENDELPELLKFDHLNPIIAYEKLKRKIELYKIFR